MGSQVEKKVLKEFDFVLSVHRTYADEYKNKDIVVYTDFSKQLNLIIHPEDYIFMKDYDCEKNHNSNLIAYPREINEGQTPTHYGYKILFDDSLSMKQFLSDYMKYKKNV